LDWLEYSCHDSVAVLTFTATSLHRGFVAALAGALDWLESKPELHAVVFTGSKSIFMSGADLREVNSLDSDDAVSDFLRLPHELMTRIYRMDKLSIAAINGYCLGGGLELALVCDIRIVANDLKDDSGNELEFLGLPEVKLGLVPALGGVSTLVATIGRSCAADFLYKGRLATAARALEIGLVDVAVAKHQLMEEAFRVTAEISDNSRPAVQSLKRLFHFSLLPEYEDTLRQAREAFSYCCTSGDKNRRLEASRQMRINSFRHSVSSSKNTDG
jgi:enoyl-CoA hydratase